MSQSAPMTAKEYVQNSDCCPFCRSSNISSDQGLKAEAGQAWQPIYCLNCGRHWDDEYVLVGYTETHEEPREEPREDDDAVSTL